MKRTQRIFSMLLAVMIIFLQLPARADWLSSLTEALSIDTSAVEEVIGTITQAAGDFWEENGEAITEAVSGFWQENSQAIATAAEQFWQENGETITNAITGFWQENGEAITNAAGGLLTAGEEMNIAAEDMTAALIEVISQYLQENGASIADNWDTLLKVLNNYWQENSPALIESTENMAASFVDFWAENKEALWRIILQFIQPADAPREAPDEQEAPDEPDAGKEDQETETL